MFVAAFTAQIWFWKLLPTLNPDCTDPGSDISDVWLLRMKIHAHNGSTWRLRQEDNLCHRVGSRSAWDNRETMSHTNNKNQS